MSGLEKLYTTRDLAERYGCKPRAVAEKAWRGEWPSTKVLGEYRFTDEMVNWIDSEHERWPQNEPAPAPAPKQPKPQPVPQTRQRRTPQPPPSPAGGNNVRRLVAKQRPNRIGRSA